MSLSSFKSFFAMVKGHVKRIAFYNWGEPFLNNDFLEMVKICSAHKVFTEIDSNLSSFDFTDETAEQIIASGLSMIRPSIDGITQESYEAYRVGGNCRRAFDNLKKLVAAKTRLNADTLIYFKFMLYAQNEHEVEGAKKIAAELGIPVRFDLLRSGRPNIESAYHKDSRKFDELNSDFNVYYYSHNKIQNRTVFPDEPRQGNKLHAVLKEGAVCYQPFETMVINWNGDAMPCCNVYGDHFALGNIFETSVEEVWNGENYRNCREFLINFGPEQNTNSVCEREICNIKKKYITKAP